MVTRAAYCVTWHVQMTEPSKETVNKQWYDEKQSRLKKEMERFNIPENKKYLLESAEVVRGQRHMVLYVYHHAQADLKRKRKIDDEDNAGVVGQTLRTTARAAEKRSANVPVDLVAYEKQKREQPEFYRAGDSLLYGGKGEVDPNAVDRMVAELNSKCVMMMGSVYLYQ